MMLLLTSFPSSSSSCALNHLPSMCIVYHDWRVCQRCNDHVLIRQRSGSPCAEMRLQWNRWRQSSRRYHSMRPQCPRVINKRCIDSRVACCWRCVML